QVVRRYLPPPPDDGRSCGPGPFSMADPETVTAMLSAAGFEEAAFERMDADVVAGSSVEEAILFQLQLGPAGEIVREAGAAAETHRAAIETDLAELLSRYLTSDGVRMGSSSWCVSAVAR